MLRDPLRTPYPSGGSTLRTSLSQLIPHPQLYPASPSRAKPPAESALNHLAILALPTPCPQYPPGRENPIPKSPIVRFNSRQPSPQRNATSATNPPTAGLRSFFSAAIRSLHLGSRSKRRGGGWDFVVRSVISIPDEGHQRRKRVQHMNR